DAYRSLYERGLDVLTGLACPAVVFVPTAFVGGVSSFDRGLSEPLEPVCGWRELRELAASGISVQSHGRSHLPLSRLAGDRLVEELMTSKHTLEDELETLVELFAFPYG